MPKIKRQNSEKVYQDFKKAHKERLTIDEVLNLRDKVLEKELDTSIDHNKKHVIMFECSSCKTLYEENEIKNTHAKNLNHVISLINFDITIKCECGSKRFIIYLSEDKL